MNAVEIEEAISELAEAEFNSDEFPFQFLEAFGNKQTTIKRLRTGSSNSSDIDGGVLQRNNIHIAVCSDGEVTSTLLALKASPTTTKAKAKFALATDGSELQAENLTSGETVACEYRDLPNHFGMFLPLAGISTVSQIVNNPIDIRATSILNKLYVELLKVNEDWSSDEKRHDMNQFMTRLIFCFFAEDTDIFDQGHFTTTIEQMSDSRSDNTDHVLSELFRAMDTAIEDRESADLPRWADRFPYVNGGLFAGDKEVPKFNRIARSFLIHAGNLNWKEINPDIFGSMIQSIAEDDERGEIGMHYTSVPNILKVLNPLFLDDLREQLEAAGDNGRKLLNLRKRIANIRVFDPACGSGNFLVIAYIQMREIEAEILKRRGEANEKSWIELENFYGIELKNFAVEVGRLSLLIAEFQCDVRLIGQKEAKALVLPLRRTGRIRQGNALRINWNEVCPTTGGKNDQSAGKHTSDFVHTETFICGNPPYVGGKKLTPDQKEDMELCGLKKLMQLDYVCCWFFKYTDFLQSVESTAAFVSTSSVCQGEQVALLWPHLFKKNVEIRFAHRPFKWQNNAQNNAGVMCCVLGFGLQSNTRKYLFEEAVVRNVTNISPYLIEGSDTCIKASSRAFNGMPPMTMGSNPVDGKNLILSSSEREQFLHEHPNASKYIRRYVGGTDILKDSFRFCLWINESRHLDAYNIQPIADRINLCKKYRVSAGRDAQKVAEQPFRFCYRTHQDTDFLALPKTSSSGRDYVPAQIFKAGPVVNVDAFAIYSAQLHIMSLIMSKMHNIWLATTSGRLGEGYRYSVKLSYNTFPIPDLTSSCIKKLTNCAVKILLTRESHFPKTIAELYDPEKMPDDLRTAHEENDETLERIYIGRRFKNDTERLEKLFDMYAKLTGK
ncbi:lactate dehydrogenase [Chromatiales bacterium (ex Bugula neritina AB1)]|nr:lactate dehydrogenase [Chromatiales bacterium (ex Bugula neritina AB1)]